MFAYVHGVRCMFSHVCMALGVCFRVQLPLFCGLSLAHFFFPSRALSLSLCHVQSHKLAEKTRGHTWYCDSSTTYTILNFLRPLTFSGCKTAIHSATRMTVSSSYTLKPQPSSVWYRDDTDVITSLPPLEPPCLLLRPSKPNPPPPLTLHNAPPET